MKTLLIYILLIGILTGIIPIMMCVLMSKIPILIILVLIFDFCWIMYELCYEGE